MKRLSTLSVGERYRAAALLPLLVVLLFGCRNLDTGTDPERGQDPPVAKENKIIQERFVSHAGTYTLVLERPERLQATQLAKVGLDILDAEGDPLTIEIVVRAEVTSSASSLLRHPLELRSLGRGRYELMNWSLPEAGAWLLRVDITRGALTERATRPLSVD